MRVVGRVRELAALGRQRELDSLAPLDPGLSEISCVGHSMRSSYVPETQSPDA